MSFLKLPHEVLNYAASFVDGQRDLLNLACSTKRWCGVIIPRHLEYRIICLTPTTLTIWKHLATQRDLASNVRELHVYGLGPWLDESEEDHGPFESEAERAETLLRLPKTLVKKYITKELLPRSTKELWSTIGAALGNMQNLTAFSWYLCQYLHIPAEVRPAIFGSLVKRQVLRNLCIEGFQEEGEIYEGYAFRGPTSMKDDPLWKIRGLETLALKGNSWYADETLVDNSPIFEWFKVLQPSLKRLSIPYPTFENKIWSLSFPQLRTLAINSEETVNAITPIALFLHEHPMVEELSWIVSRQPTEEGSLPPEFLPNLNRLATSIGFLEALNSNDTPRKIEHLSLMTTYEFCRNSNRECEILVNTNCLDRDSLKCLYISNPGGVESLCRVGREFPNIEQLGLPPFSYVIKQKDLLRILAAFPNLNYLEAPDLWANHMGNMPESGYEDSLECRDLITKVLRVCPKLKGLVWYKEHKKLRINRKKVEWKDSAKLMGDWLGLDKSKVESKEIITFDIVNRPPADIFDVLLRNYADGP